jgi:toxin secretion/phage lysis holin
MVLEMKTLFNIFDFSNLFNIRTGFAGLIGGAAGGFLSKIYGGELHIYFISVLGLTIIFDWIGGTIAAKKDGIYASAYGIQGIFRTAVMLALPVWGSLIDSIIGNPVSLFFYILWAGIFCHTSISMTANFKRIGWNIWIPTWALEWVTSEIEAKLNRVKERTPSKEE